MADIKVLFLGTGEQVYRCLMAKNILQSFDAEIKVYSAVIPPVPPLSPVKVIALEKLGFEISDNDLQLLECFSHHEFDFLIILSKLSVDDLKKYTRNYRVKLHMELPEIKDSPLSEDEAVFLLRRVREEIENELDYFVHTVLKKSVKIFL